MNTAINIIDESGWGVAMRVGKECSRNLMYAFIQSYFILIYVMGSNDPLVSFKELIDYI